MRTLLPVLICVFAVFAGFAPGTNSAADAVPRRHAYPRVEPYDSASRTVVLAPFTFRIAAEAPSKRTGENWLDVSYPRYGATMHLSASRFGSADEAAEALANRRQRISLNTGGALARTDFFDNDAGLTCEMTVCSEGVATPVQFIATDGKSLMLSGAVMINGPITPADSIRPIINLLQDEAFTILSSIRKR